MPLARAIHKVSNALDKICGGVCIAMLAAMVIITGLQIICRLFFTALSWSEELCRYLLIWSTFIGAGIVYKHGGHIAVTLLHGFLPPAAGKAVRTLIHVICGAFCAISVFYGFRYMGMQGNQLSAAMRIPMKYMYMCIPIGFTIMEVHVVDAIIQLLIRRPSEEVEVSLE